MDVSCIQNQESFRPLGLRCTRHKEQKLSIFCEHHASGIYLICRLEASATGTCNFATIC